MGWGDLATDKFNVWGTASYNVFEGLAASDRSFSKTAFLPDLNFDKTSGRSAPANVATPAGARNPFNPECAPPFSFPTPGSPLQCRFDYAATIDIRPPQQMWNALGKATWQLNPNTQIYLEGLWAQNKVQAGVSPTPVDATTVLNPANQPLLLPPTSPFYPHAFAQQFGIDGQPLSLNWRTVWAGPRRGTERPNGRASPSRRRAMWDWDYDATAVWNQNKSNAAYQGG